MVLEMDYYNWKNCVGDYKPNLSERVLGDRKDKRASPLIQDCETVLKDEMGEYVVNTLADSLLEHKIRRIQTPKNNVFGQVLTIQKISLTTDLPLCGCT